MVLTTTPISSFRKKKHFHWSKSSASELETTFVVFFLLSSFLIIAMCQTRAGKVFQRSRTKNAACGAGIKERRSGVLFRFNWRSCGVSTHSVIIVMYISVPLLQPLKVLLHWTSSSFTLMVLNSVEPQLPWDTNWRKHSSQSVLMGPSHHQPPNTANVMWHMSGQSWRRLWTANLSVSGPQ